MKLKVHEVILCLILTDSLKILLCDETALAAVQPLDLIHLIRNKIPQ